MSGKFAKFGVAAALAAVVIGAALFGAQTAFAQGPNPGAGTGWMAAYREQMHAMLAEALGLTVEEFDQELASGKTAAQIAEEQGYTRQEFRAIMLEIRAEIIRQAVADGVITQAQADWMLSHMGQGGGYGSGPMGGPGAGPMSGAGGNCPYANP